MCRLEHAQDADDPGEKHTGHNRGHRSQQRSQVTTEVITPFLKTTSGINVLQWITYRCNHRFQIKNVNRLLNK